jgi:GxxExxY protein
MTRRPLIHEALTSTVIGCFFEVYNNMGHGALESLHLAALEREIRHSGHRVARELKVRVMYKGEEIGMQRLDMVVDDLVVVEVKSSEDLPKLAHRQLYNYLRITNLEVGLLLHFGLEPRFYRIFCEQDRKPWRMKRLERLSSARRTDP